MSSGADSRPNVGVVIFPGSNCDQDMLRAVGPIMGWRVHRLWHKEAALPAGLDLIALPGGFSYGDYLRCGAIARFSPVMRSVVEFAARGGLVLGVCNGFQILTEAGLLPGALARNASLRFRCVDVRLRVERDDTAFTSLASFAGTRDAERARPVLRIPIAHGEGRYVLDPDGLRRLEDRGGVLFRYCDAQGRATPQSNPNGSLANIAGIVNEAGNVMGMMPHPERACEAILGGDDGRHIFESLAAAIAGAVGAA